MLVLGRTCHMAFRPIFGQTETFNSLRQKHSQPSIPPPQTLRHLLGVAGGKFSVWSLPRPNKTETPTSRGWPRMNTWNLNLVAIQPTFDCSWIRYIIDISSFIFFIVCSKLFELFYVADIQMLKVYICIDPLAGYQALRRGNFDTVIALNSRWRAQVFLKNNF